MDPEIAIVGHIINETIVFPDRVIAPVLGSPVAYSSVISSVLGARVGIVTKVGEDFPAELLEPLREANVDLSGLTSHHRQSTANIMTYAEDGHKDMQYRTQAPPIYYDDVPERYHDASLIFVCPMYYEVPIETVEALSSLTGTLIVDLGGYGGATSATHPSPEERENNKEIQSISQAVDVVKASIEDCRHILPAHLTPEQLAKAFVEWGARIGIVTLGKDGALAVEGSKVYQVRSPLSTAVDVTGAGDAFSAGFLVDYLHHRGVEQATRFGCATASLVIEDSGGVRVARMPSIDAVKQRLQANGT